MEQYLNLISVPVIAAIVYWVVNLIKYATKQNEKVKRWIPLMAASLGAICGVVAFYTLPSIIPAENVFAAILIGIASGLTATGTNQIIKQLGKVNENGKNDNGSDTEKPV